MADEVNWLMAEPVAYEDKVLECVSKMVTGISRSRLVADLERGYWVLRVITRALPITIGISTSFQVSFDPYSPILIHKFIIFKTKK